jgi:hypothetical protein
MEEMKLKSILREYKIDLDVGLLELFPPQELLLGN